MFALIAVLAVGRATANQDFTTSTENVPTSVTATADIPTTETIPQPSVQSEATSVSLPNGVEYQVIKPGTGSVASTTQSMFLHYELYLTSGRRIESSREIEIPLPIKLTPGQGDFIPGVEAAVQGMRVGEIRRMYIPADQAYGAAGKPPVPPNAPLIFLMELVNIK